MKIAIGAVGGGVVFGAVTSVANDVSSPYGEIGGRLVAGGWSWLTDVFQFASHLLDTGWAWAAVAVVVGRLARAVGWGAVAGALTLIAATTTYYLADSVFHGESLDFYGRDMLFWWLPAVLVGPLLGMAGALTHRPGLLGLFAALAVPIGALVQMIVFPPGGTFQVPDSAIYARAAVTTAALLSTALLLFRFTRRRTVTASAATGSGDSKPASSDSVTARQPRR